MDEFEAEEQEQSTGREKTSGSDGRLTTSTKICKTKEPHAGRGPGCLSSLWLVMRQPWKWMVRNQSLRQALALQKKRKPSAWGLHCSYL